MSEDKKLDKQKTINYTVIIFYIGAYVIYNFFLKLFNSFFCKKEVKQIKQEKEEDKYLNECKELELNDVSDERLKELEDCFIEEETENYGNIRMFYNESFIYYTTERKSVSYSILDMVARKYVIHYNCKLLYIDINDEINKIKDQIEKEPVESKKKIDDVFAQFKDYNIVKKNNKNIKSKINNFKYGGKISEIPTKKISRESHKLSYSDYKKNN